MIARLNSALALALCGPPELGGKPVPDDALEGGGAELNWLVDAPWAKVALLITLAVGVLVLTNTLMRNRRARGGLRPRPDFDLRVAKLESLPHSDIAAAVSGPAHVEGVLEKGEGALGTGEFACVYHNRHGSGRATAIASELVLLADGTGLLGLENLEQARVIAPREDDGPHDTISLYLGDRVQVLGDLLVLERAKTLAEGELRGMLGSLGQIQIRVLERARPEQAEPEPEPEPEPTLEPSPDSPSEPASEA